MKQLYIYVHIPFCLSKCNYCDFLSFAVDKNKESSVISEYVKALVMDIELARNDFSGHIVQTIFFGGGTPSLLASGEIKRILEAIRENYNVSEEVEITIECNPETVNVEKLSNFFAIGINRLSFGVQSFDDEILKGIGRIHSSQKAIEVIKGSKKIGFDNVSLDLMYALPSQNLGHLIQTIKTALELSPEHISCYSLILEQGTKLYDDKSAKFTGETGEVEMYEESKRLFKQNGYEQYEISNFAKKGFRSKHNLCYWENKEYVGFGLGASSYVGMNKRFSKTSDLASYLKHDFSEKNVVKYDIKNKVERRNLMSEFMFLGLRKIEGIKFAEFEKDFHVGLMDVYKKEIDVSIERGLLEEFSDGIRLTEKGVYLSNSVFVEFL